MYPTKTKSGPKGNLSLCLEDKRHNFICFTINVKCAIRYVLLHNRGHLALYSWQMAFALVKCLGFEYNYFHNVSLWNTALVQL